MLIAGTERCPSGHDMHAPGAWSQVNPAGTHGQCRECRNVWQKKRGARYTQCRQCGKQHPPSTSTYCSSKCQAVAHAHQKGNAARAIEHRREDKTLAILRLSAARDRASMHWEREAIDKQLQELRA